MRLGKQRHTKRLHGLNNSENYSDSSDHGIEENLHLQMREGGHTKNF